MNLQTYLKEMRAEVDAALDRLLPEETVNPETIHKAMRYSIFAGGKRLRPILCLAAAEACGGDQGAAVPLGCALECIHTYSLVHDDLPCMDDDDFRRGNPTSHKVFGEGVAVLAGDSLLTQAFEMVAEAPTSENFSTAECVRELAVTSGSLKLIAGQVMDLEGEGKEISLEDLQFIHESKTAALLTTSLRFGGMSANASQEEMQGLTDFGNNLGLAFQVVDDILDVTQTSEQLGKSAGKDVAAEKATYPKFLGLEKSREEAARLTEAARDALAVFGEEGNRLREIADYMLARDY